MRNGVAAALEAGRQADRQAGRKRESVAASSVAYPHGIRLPEPRPCRQPSGAQTKDEFPAEERERAPSPSGNSDVLPRSVSAVLLSFS